MNRFFVLAFGLIVISGCSDTGSTPSTAHLRGDASLPRLLEGLPHRVEDTFSTEKQRSDAEELHDYWFYSSIVLITDKDFDSIASVLQADGTLKKWMGEKLCGGFHPDWLVRLSTTDGQVTYLICFGCHEAKVIAASKEIRYDLSDKAYSALAKLLRSRRINRPASDSGATYLR